MCYKEGKKRTVKKKFLAKYFHVRRRRIKINLINCYDRNKYIKGTRQIKSLCFTARNSFEGKEGMFQKQHQRII
jgi:hypothetical protein